tara:strand:+ start:22167 stop:22664 length:498 start_codon:yes stop_codon:yes gene_type:complete
MKIYALTTLQRYGIEIQVRLFDTIEQCRKEYNLLIKDFENNKDYIVNKGTEHTEIEYEEGLEILVSIKTYELNDLVNNQVHCVIKGNQECDYINNENLYLFNNETKATKQFLDLLYQHKENGYDIGDVEIKYADEEYKEYFSFDDNDYDWGHCKTELIKIESEVK